MVKPTITTSIWHRYKGFAFLAIMAVLLLLVGACSVDGKQSTLEAAGPVAQKQLDLFYVVFWVMVAVFIIVEGMLLYAAIRYRRRPNQELPKQVHGNFALELTWTIIPTLLIMAVGVWTVIAIFDLDQPPSSSVDKTLNIEVTGHQWWWEFKYFDANGLGKEITTANELRVPVDTTIVLQLESADVIHSFWIPKLAGKVDVVPNRTNSIWFEADSNKIDSLPQMFFGQCAEFCGIAHAWMKFRVQVLTQEAYNTWANSYGQAPVLSELAQKGQDLFLDPGPGGGTCLTCHTIEGVSTAAVGPNLTDLATRSSLGAGLIEFDADGLRSWLINPNDVKPGNRMSKLATTIYETPDSNIDLGENSDEKLDALIAYLLSLK
jgi:cytochrome c oxidase subunit 2